MNIILAPNLSHKYSTVFALIIQHAIFQINASDVFVKHKYPAAP